MRCVCLSITGTLEPRLILRENGRYSSREQWNDTVARDQRDDIIIIIIVHVCRDSASRPVRHEPERTNRKLVVAVSLSDGLDLSDSVSDCLNLSDGIRSRRALR